MEEERLMILRMLEEGKITAAEAAELLRALEEGRGGDAPGGATGPRPGERIAEAAREAARDVARSREELARRLARLGEELAERLGDRAGRMVELIERRVEQSLRRVPELVRAIEHLDLDLGLPQRLERVIEGRLAAAGGPVTVELTGMNGPIQVEGWEGEGFRLTVAAHLPARPSAGPTVDLAEWVRVEQDETSLRVTPAGSLRALSLSLRLPAAGRYALRLRTSNSGVLVAGLTGTRLEASSDNGKIVAHGVTFEEALLETANARVDVAGAVRSLTAFTSNAPVLAAPDLAGLPGDAAWQLRTSNSGISCRVPVGESFGFDVEASTSLGRVAVDVGELRLDGGGEPRQRVGFAGVGVVRGRTPGFEQRPHRLTLRARTSNGSIRIGPHEAGPTAR